LSQLPLSLSQQFEELPQNFQPRMNTNAHE
jgi:hypothetical protein